MAYFIDVYLSVVGKYVNNVVLLDIGANLNNRVWYTFTKRRCSLKSEWVEVTDSEFGYYNLK